MKILFIFTILFLFSFNAFSQQIPSEIKGNWLNAADSIEWLYSFQPEFAVFDTKFWEYKTITRHGGEYKLQLVNGKEKELLTVKAIDSTSLLITAEGRTPTHFTNQKARKPDFRNYDTQEFKEPILVDGTATIFGFIEDYDPDAFSKDAKISYYSVLTGYGKGAETKFEIQPDGRFVVKFRMFNPQSVWLNIEGSTQTTVFVKPGETAIICFNKLLRDVTVDDRKWEGVSDWQINHYMGKSGLLSDELLLLSSYKNGVDPVLKRTNMGVMPQLPYQKWRKQVYENEVKEIDSVTIAMHCSAKARQVMKIALDLSLLEDLNRYSIENQTKDQFSQKYIDRFPFPGTSPELNLLFSEYYAYVISLYDFYSIQVLAGVYLPMINAYMDYFAKHVANTSDLKIINNWKTKYGSYSWPDLSDRYEKEDRQSDTLQIKSFYDYSLAFNKMSQKYWTKIEESFKDSIWINGLDYVMDKYNSNMTGQMYCMYFLIQIQEYRTLNATYVNWAKRRIASPILLNYLLEINKSNEEIKKKITSYAVGTHFIDSITCDKNSDAFFTTI